ncbi:MAG TPA: STAS domain-containing protein [Candidatus Limnocylindria bacterium]|nr:STAS domain-containing protein [Candidatus Limnocylindria bacterium]
MYQQEREPAVVAIVGESDIAARGEMRAALQAAADNPRVIVDLTALRYLDSAVIDELFRAHTRCERLRGRLVIVAQDQRLVRLLSITGLTGRVTIADTLANAFALLRPAVED